MIYDESDKLSERENEEKAANEEEDVLNLRPRTLFDYVGQKKRLKP